MRYRKRPVIVEAVRWTGDMTKVVEFIGHDLPVYDIDKPSSLLIHTLEGDMEVSEGDWIIRGVKNEYYPCKDDIFRLTYEEVG